MTNSTDKAKRQKRPRKIQARTIETKTKLLAAAAKEFAEKGFEGASTRSVASRAGVPHTLLTYHFESKDGLWKTVVTNMNDRLYAMYQSRLEAMSDAESHLRLRLILEGFVKFSFENPDFHWIMSHEASRAGERFNWLRDEHIHTFFFTVGQLIQDSQKSGNFVEGDPKHLIYLFIGCVTRIFMIRNEVEDILELSLDDDRFIRRHTDLCMTLFFRYPDIDA